MHKINNKDFIVWLEYTSHLFFYCFYLWLWTGNCLLIVFGALLQLRDRWLNFNIFLSHTGKNIVKEILWTLRKNFGDLAKDC